MRMAGMTVQVAYIFILIVRTKTSFATEAKVNLGLGYSSMSCSGSLWLILEGPCYGQLTPFKTRYSLTSITQNACTACNKKNWGARSRDRVRGSLALKVTTEEGSNLLSSKEVTMATEPQPTSRHLSTQHWTGNTSVWNWYLLKSVGGREGKASKQASRATPAMQLQQRNFSKSTWQCPCGPPWTPHQILGKWQHWLDFNFA